MTKILVTGATGFVGHALLPALLSKGHEVVAAVRGKEADLPEGVKSIRVGDIDGDTNWRAALWGCEAVVHLAARVHVMKETAADPAGAFDVVNVDGARHLAEEAALAGISRFVFMSSVKVMAESSPSDRMLTESDLCRPTTDYGRSKLRGERAVLRVGEKTTMGVTVLRSPLVYGFGVGGNFAKLIKLCKSGMPLPLGGVQNKRSLIYVGNLADAVVRTLERDETSGRTFLVSDGPPVSTPELVQAICSVLKIKARLVNIPPVALDKIRAMSGGGIIDKLYGDLALDTMRFRARTGWRPPFGFEEAIRKTLGVE
ncbi:MAG: NAD-dependent epimerase/dehydratase family protein [Pseudomonadota bacterium]|nr:NAD-dependent epimerase/dehydratase family protein [Pseudomonadota bacterium]